MKYFDAVLKFVFASAGLVIAALVGMSIALLSDHRDQVDRLPVSPVPIAVAVKTNPAPSSPEELYLDLLKKTLTRAQTAGRYIRRTPQPKGMVERAFFSLVGHMLSPARLQIVELVPSDPQGFLEAGGVNLELRQDDAETMIGTRQLDNIQFCVTDVLKRKVPGDLIECGAWRGGATILMRAVLRAYGDDEKSVWVADSFEGLPSPRSRFDFGLQRGEMAVSLEEVQENFARYGLLDKRVRFLKGFFNKTLPTAPITKLSVLRADADLYDSQMDVLNNLYPELSVGGYVIIDDYLEIAGCRRAIDEYRKTHNITEEIRPIDTEGIYWQKLR
ncbi:MAG: TylF/MycF/NovP-related O-methyltransferase [Terriglobia bacterium]